MRLATLPNGTRDGAIHLVARDGTRAVSATSIAPTLLTALEVGERIRTDLEALSADLERGGCDGTVRQVRRARPAAAHFAMARRVRVPQPRCTAVTLAQHRPDSVLRCR